MKKTTLGFLFIILLILFVGCSTDEIIENENLSESALINRAKAYLNRKDYDNALLNIKNAIDKNPEKNTVEAFLVYADIMIATSNVEACTMNLDMVIDLEGTERVQEHLMSYSMDQMEALAYKSYMAILKHYVTFDQLLIKMAEREKVFNTYSTYYVNGVYLFEAGYFIDAINALEKSYELNDDHNIALFLLHVYYESDRIYKCQDLALKLLDNNKGIYQSKYYLALCKKALADYEYSNNLFEELLDEEALKDQFISKSKYNIYFHLSDTYHNFLNEDDKALSYIHKYKLQHTNVDQYMKEISEDIEKGEKLEDIIYLHGLFEKYYLSEISDINLSDYIGHLSDDDIFQVFESLKQEDDSYSFILDSEDYNVLSVDESDFVFEILENDVYYFSFDRFYDTVHYDFIANLDTIENTEESRLIIDLRNNHGGMLLPAFSILDNFIDDEILLERVFKDGTTINYVANKSKLEFEKIYILVNENSASGSEIMAMALNLFLDNTSILGQVTKGKGVGQEIISDQENQRRYVITNYQWKILDQSIHQKGISPDIILNDDEILLYLDELLELNLTEF